ncbi:hypothetical protein FBU30_009944 [Linnemannia zychae]|nr:hypothetical protein FBU30_009944 [Linnemannia zychae]
MNGPTAQSTQHYDRKLIPPSESCPQDSLNQPQPAYTSPVGQEQFSQQQQQYLAVSSQLQDHPFLSQEQQQQQQQQQHQYQEEGLQLSYLHDDQQALQQISVGNQLRRCKSCPPSDHNTLATGSNDDFPRNTNPYCYYSDKFECPQSNSIHGGRHQREQQEIEESLANASCFKRTRYQIGIAIESKAAHITILVLTVCDIILVMLQIGASLLHLDENEHEHWVLKLFEHLSLSIVSVFMLEILLKLFAFGPRYYWIGTRHWFLHVVDAVIIIMSFMLEIFLKGAEQELSSLLIVFRLWRVIKLTGTVALEVTEHDQAHVEILERKVQSLERELEENRLKIQHLEGISKS